MPWLLTLAWAFVSQTLGLAMPMNVSTLTVGAPIDIADLDLGKLKGNLRQIGWSGDGTQVYVQTADGTPPNQTLRHYVVATSGGALMPVDAEPPWAQQYWAHKSDRNAPGAPALEIDVQQKRETTKIGTGSGRPGTATTSMPDSMENAAMASEGQRENVVRFVLLGETISEFAGVPPVPGLMFSWGPRGTGAIAYTDAAGRLMLMDQERHKRTIAGVKDAILPAWSMDGERMAYAVKSCRKKYKLVWCTITR